MRAWLAGLPTTSPLVASPMAMPVVPVRPSVRVWARLSRSRGPAVLDPPQVPGNPTGDRPTMPSEAERAAEPLKVASPSVKTPPSLATIRYPLPDAVAAMPITGRSSGWAAAEPAKTASPNVKTPPSMATSQ